MELTRVSRQRSEHPKGVAPTGGDADALALLLGGDQANAASAFPATLEAAIAGGEVGEEPIALDGDATGDGTDTGDASGETVDLSIAAALALGSALATPTDEAPTPTDGTTDATTVAAAGKDAAAGVVDATLAAAAAGKATGEVPAAAASATGTTVPVVETSSTADADAAQAAEAAAKVAVPADDAAQAKQVEATAGATKPDATAAGATSAATLEAPRDVRLGEPKAGHGEEATRHGASAGIEPEHASFASGAGEQHGGLDLGSSERDQTTAAPLAAEKPVVHASASVPATELARSDAPTAPHAPPADATSATTVTTTPATTTTHDTAAPRADRLGHHMGAIEPRWGERVADAVRLSAVRGGGEIRLQLEPEGLGHIDVRLHLQGDGVRAVIVAEHESTRALLTSQQQVLHEALERSDIRLSGFTVDVGTGGNGAASFAEPDGQGSGADAAGTSTWREQGARTDDGAAETTTAAVQNGRLSVRV